MSSDLKLTVELVPSTSWGNNLRSEANLPTSKWDALRRASYQKAGYRCEVCGGKGKKHPVECHEIWHYDDQSKTQTLKGLVSLCPLCHQAKHLGRSLSLGKTYVLEHLAKVNQLTAGELERYVVEVFQTWEERSQHEWALNLDWLDTQGSHTSHTEGFFDLSLGTTLGDEAKG